jgi:hypothetical protein
MGWEAAPRWLTQGHIFASPFYYIDYTLAQVLAFEFFNMDRKNHAKGLEEVPQALQDGRQVSVRDAHHQRWSQEPLRRRHAQEDDQAAGESLKRLSRRKLLITERRRLGYRMPQAFFSYKKDVEKSLELADKHNWCSKAVVYTNETTDMTDAVIELIKTDPSQRITPRDWPDFFSKGIFWRGEHEFRYSVGNHFFKGYKRGRRLHNLKPCKIYLGFRFEKQQAVIDCCKKNEIPCFICRPDFFGDIKKIVFEKAC